MSERAPSRHAVKLIVSLISALVLLACGSREAHVAVTDAIYRAPLGGAEVGVGYLTIQSRRSDRIIGMDSPMARSVEMHETVLTGTSSSMHQRQDIDLPAKQPVVFGPGGLHLMIFDPQALENGATFPLTVRLESGEAIHVELAVWKGPLDGG